MTKTTATPGQAPVFAGMPVAPLAFEPMIAVNQRGMRAAGDAMVQMFARWEALSAEVLRFVDRRLEADREAAKAMAACGSPQQAAEVYTKFVETAVQHYSQEIGLLAGLAADQGRDAVENATRAAALPDDAPAGEVRPTSARRDAARSEETRSEEATSGEPRPKAARREAARREETRSEQVRPKAARHTETEPRKTRGRKG